MPKDVLAIRRLPWQDRGGHGQLCRFLLTAHAVSKWANRPQVLLRFTAETCWWDMNHHYNGNGLPYVEKNTRSIIPYFCIPVPSSYITNRQIYGLLFNEQGKEKIRHTTGQENEKKILMPLTRCSVLLYWKEKLCHFFSQLSLSYIANLLTDFLYRYHYMLSGNKNLIT